MNMDQCPPEALLQEYLLGEISQADSQTLDSHLTECSRCQETVDELGEIDSSWAHLLRSLPGVNEKTDPSLDSLVAQAKKLRPGMEIPRKTSQVELTQEQSQISCREFLARVRQTGLLADEDLDEIFTQLSSETSNEHGRTIAQEMILQGKLTPYQADQILISETPLVSLGNYTLLEPLGSGGMGQVFKAYHRPMKRTVALKILRPGGESNSDLKNRFQREIESAGKLSHPHIVSAHDAGEDRGRIYLVMELVQGRDLAWIVDQEGPLSVGKAVDYVLQAATGIAYAHDRGILHRDIKPANLLVDDQGKLKVSDLGLARLYLQERTEPGDLTSQNAILGTPAYMAPEQAASPRTIDGGADVYSLGCTLYFLLTGKPPYAGESSMEVLLAHNQRQIPSLRDSCPQCPTDLEILFQKMLAKNPAQRPRSMAEVQSALEAIQRDLANNEVARTEKIAISQAHNARPGSLILISGLLAVLLAVIPLGVFLSGKMASRPEETKQNPEQKDPVKISGQVPKVGSKLPAIDMVLIPAGSFLMGSGEKDSMALPNEKPAHGIHLSQAFYLGKFEITQEQYQKVMGNNPSAFSSQGKFRAKAKDTGKFPIESISWLDAIVFCNKLSERHGLSPYYQVKDGKVSILGGGGYRLPTEAEWEFACRGGTDTPWSFGKEEKKLGDYAWFGENSEGKTHPVGQKKANPLGLFDMHGNVPEWCWDRYDGTYYARSRVYDPAGSGEGLSRVYRGGSWDFLANQTRSAARHGLGSAYGQLTLVGLRVARTVEE